MAEKSNIEWTDATYNPWIGCTKVGPGCDHCYAERLSKRAGWVVWGPGQKRKRKSENTRDEPRRWNENPRLLIEDQWPGRRPRVFCASLADVFDNEVPDDWRADLWKMIRETPNLDWIIVTKRIGNAAKMLPPDWGAGYPNVILVITVVNQEEADRDVPKLLRTPARRRGLSIEPILGAINLAVALRGYRHIPISDVPGHVLNDMPGAQSFTEDCPRIDWVIVGGESGAEARPPHPRWIRDLRDQCSDAGVPFFFKQWGEFGPVGHPKLDARHAVAMSGQFTRAPGHTWIQERPGEGLTFMYRVGKKVAGAKLDGREHRGFYA